MASYPSSIHTKDTRGGLMSDAETHPTWHDNEQDEIIAIETELGVTPSGGFSTVAARLAALDPDGDGTSAPWTPTWSNLTVGNGTVVARFWRIGPEVRFYVQVVLGSTSAVTGSVVLSNLPVAILAPSNQEMVSRVEFLDQSAGQSFTGVLKTNTSTSAVLRRLRDDTGTSANDIRELGIGTSSPFTWANTDQINIAGSYAAA